LASAAGVASAPGAAAHAVTATAIKQNPASFEQIRIMSSHKPFLFATHSRMPMDVAALAVASTSAQKKQTLFRPRQGCCRIQVTSRQKIEQQLTQPLSMVRGG
jgi:hypothetical protein